MKGLMKELKFGENGLIPAIIQDYRSEKVLTLCYMTEEALTKTLDEGKVYLFRRSKNRLMLKGETSGHVQTLREILIDCEGKSLLLRVEQKVAACHAGYFTCYFRRAGKGGSLDVIEKKVFDPEKVY